MLRPPHPFSLALFVAISATACSAEMTEDTALSRSGDVARTVGHGQSEAVQQVCFSDAYDDSTCFSVKPADASMSGYHYPDMDDERYREPTAYLDLDSIHSDTWIASSFQLWEFAQGWKGRWAVVQPRAVETLQTMRDDVGPIMIYSGYRSPAYNRSVNGKHTSRHMYGDGFDFNSEFVSRHGLAQACHDHGASYVEVYQTHVHCDWRDGVPEPAFFGEEEQPNNARTASTMAEELGRDAMIIVDNGHVFAETEGFDEGEPLIEWTAFDEHGTPIEISLGAVFAPPADTAAVSVRVGEVLTRTLVLD